MTPLLNTANDELLTISEAAQRVHATVKQIRRRIKAGLLPAVRPPGARAYLVRVEDLDRLYSPVLVAAETTAPRETEIQRRSRRLADSGLVRLDVAVERKEPETEQQYIARLLAKAGLAPESA